MSELKVVGEPLEETRLRVVGQPIPKPDSWEKVMGGSGYPVNVRLPGMLHAKLLRSPYAHARIVKIDTSKASRVRGVKAILTYKDVPAITFTPYAAARPGALSVVKDMRILENKVRFVGDAVAAVAADSVEAAEEATELIDVDYDVLPSVFDPEEALKPDAPQLHESKKGNVALAFGFGWGDVEKGFEEADHLFEGEYETPRVHTCYMEPRVCVASTDETGNLRIHATIQSIFGLRQSLSEALGIPESKITVVKPPYIGGGFGGKLEMSFLEPVCALLSRRTRRPVRMEYTRAEDFVTTSRNRIRMYLKTGVKKDGKLTSRYMKSILDTGAHATQGPAVLISHGTVGFLGQYKCANQKWEGLAVYTNSVIGGGYRGYGAPQAMFAVESQLDEIAEELGLDPVEVRLRNGYSEGEPNPQLPGNTLSTYALRECIARGAESIGWRNRAPHSKKIGMMRKGVGFACMPLWVSGCVGVPDLYEQSGAVVKVDPDGSVSVGVGVVDPGAGENVVLCQIVAEELGVPFSNVKLGYADTDTVPFDPGTHASRVTFVAGTAVKEAAKEAKRELLQVAGEMFKMSPDDLRLSDGQVYTKGGERKCTVAEVATMALLPTVMITERGPQLTAGPKGTIIGAAAVSPPANSSPSAAIFVEVEVDMETGNVKVTRAVYSHDAGRVINPLAAEGQVEGGFAQGVGYALMEQMLFDKDTGTCLTTDFLDYKIPTAMEMPSHVASAFVEKNDPAGPFGAKGLGEPPLNIPAPAIANAVYNAVGVRIRELPITPGKILEALGGS